jgi:hypothetical protein
MYLEMLALRLELNEMHYLLSRFEFSLTNIELVFKFDSYYRKGY